MSKRSKFSEEIGEYRSLIFRAWKSPSQRDQFDGLQKRFLAGSRAHAERLKAFWAAYQEMSVELGPVEGVEIPEEYIIEQVEEEEVDVEEVITESRSVDIMGDFKWAYDTDPTTACRDDAPSAGAWFFLHMKKTNSNKFTDFTFKISERDAALKDEQASRKANYRKAVGLLEEAAKEHLESEDYREVRESLRLGAERFESKPAVSTEDS